MYHSVFGLVMRTLHILLPNTFFRCQIDNDEGAFYICLAVFFTLTQLNDRQQSNSLLRQP